MGKSRKEWVRLNFEAVRDLTWAEALEPQLRQHGVDSAEMKVFREAWNRHAETRDWAWWQNESKGYSNERLEAEVMECVERMDAIGMMQWRADQEARPREQLKQLLGDVAGKEDQPQEPSRTVEKGRDM